MADLLSQDSSPKGVPPPPPSSVESISAPPLPLEAKIRTMASDLQSIVTAGGIPQFQNVMGAAPHVPHANGFKTTLVIGGVVFLSLLFLGLAGYYLVYPFFFPKHILQEGGEVPQPGGAASQPLTPAGTPPATPLQPSRFEHQSVFRKPADQVFSFVVGGPASSASELQTFSQKLSGILSEASATSTFFEIVFQNSDGSGFSLMSFLSLIDGAFLDPQFLSANFSPDFTYALYKDKNGFWPGYFLELKPNKNWLFLKNDIGLLEASPKLPNLFLSPPGMPALGGFTDAVVGGESVRTLSFPNTSTTFFYGWLRGYLILDTSEAGLKEALSRL